MFKRRPTSPKLSELTATWFCSEKEPTFEKLSDFLIRTSQTHSFSERELADLEETVFRFFTDSKGRLPKSKISKYSDFFGRDYSVLACKLSKIHPVLSKHDPIYPSEDSATKEQKRIRIETYAQKHRLNPAEAALIYHDILQTPHPFKQNLLPLVTASFLALLPICLYGKGLIWMFFSFIPIFEGSRALWDRIRYQHSSHSFPALCIESCKNSQTLPRIMVTFVGMLSDGKKICRQMEDSYLADHFGNPLFVALLSLPDACSAELLSDSSAISEVRSHIRQLCQKYGDCFLLLIRKREYDPARKNYPTCQRDPICDLTLLLSQKPSSVTVDPDKEEVLLQNLDYLMICQKSDLIPHGFFRRLYGILLHPGNQPIFRGGKVICGYGGLQVQCRVIPNSSESLFSELPLQHPTPRPIFSIPLLCRQNIDANICFLDQKRMSVGYTDQIFLFTTAVTSPADYFLGIREAGSECVRATRRCDFRNAEPIDRWRLLRKITRDAIPILLLGLIFSSLTLSQGLATWSLLSAISVYLLPFLFCFGRTLRNLFCRRRMNNLLLFGKEFLSLLFRIGAIPFSAVCCFIGMIVKKKPKTPSEKHSIAVFTGFWLSQSGLGILLSLLGTHPFKIAIGILWILFPPFLLLLLRKRAKIRLRNVQKYFLSDFFVPTWNYFEKYSSDDYLLPPFSICESPYASISDRTSPAVLGLTLCAFFAAYDLHRIDLHTLLSKCRTLIGQIENLPKKNGLLYSNYPTDLKKIHHDITINTSECGLFAICLNTILGGLAEIAPIVDREKSELSNLICRIQKLIDLMDFSYLKSANRPFLNECVQPNSKEQTSVCDSFLSQNLFAYLAGITNQTLPADSLLSCRTGILFHNGFCGVSSAHGALDEYLLPLLFFPSASATLLKTGADFAIRTQIRTSHQKRLPIFGSGIGVCFAFDAYHVPLQIYGGNPLLAEKTSDTEVVHPYTSFLSAMLRPHAAISNLRKEVSMGAVGPYGFYDAVDFRKTRVGASFAIPEVYRTDHQAMILIATSNLLCDRVFEKRLLSGACMTACLPLILYPMPSFVGSVKHPQICFETGLETTEFKTIPSSYAQTLHLRILHGKITVFLSNKGHFQMAYQGTPIQRFCFDRLSPADLGESLRVCVKVGNRWGNAFSGLLTSDGHQALYRSHDAAPHTQTTVFADPQLPILRIEIENTLTENDLSAAVFLCFQRSGHGIGKTVPQRQSVFLQDRNLWIGLTAVDPTDDEKSYRLSCDSRFLPTGYQNCDLFAAADRGTPLYRTAEENIAFAMIKTDATSQKRIRFIIGISDSEENLLQILDKAKLQSETPYSPYTFPTSDSESFQEDPIAEWMLFRTLFMPSHIRPTLEIVPMEDVPPGKIDPLLSTQKKLAEQGFPITLRIVPPASVLPLWQDALQNTDAICSAKLQLSPPHQIRLQREDSILLLTTERNLPTCSISTPPADIPDRVVPYGNARLITLLYPHSLGFTCFEKNGWQSLTVPPYGALCGCFGERLICQTEDKKIDLAASAQCKFTPGCAVYTLRSPLSGCIRVGCSPTDPIKLILTEGIPYDRLSLLIHPFNRKISDSCLQIRRDGETTFFCIPNSETVVWTATLRFSHSVGFLLGIMDRKKPQDYYAIRGKYRCREDFERTFADYGQIGNRYRFLTRPNSFPNGNFVYQAYLWNILHFPSDPSRILFFLYYDPITYRQHLLDCVARLPCKQEYPAEASHLIYAVGKYLQATEDIAVLDEILPYCNAPYRESFYLHLIRVIEGISPSQIPSEYLQSISAYLHLQLPTDPVCPSSPGSMTVIPYAGDLQKVGTYGDMLSSWIEHDLGLNVFPDGFSLSPHIPKRNDLLELRFADSIYLIRIRYGSKNSILLDKLPVSGRIRYEKGKHLLEITLSRTTVHPQNHSAEVGFKKNAP